MCLVCMRAYNILEPLGHECCYLHQIDHCQLHKDCAHTSHKYGICAATPSQKRCILGCHIGLFQNPHQQYTTRVVVYNWDLCYLPHSHRLPLDLLSLGLHFHWQSIWFDTDWALIPGWPPWSPSGPFLEHLHPIPLSFLEASGQLPLHHVTVFVSSVYTYSGQFSIQNL
jgi:hypothetical protein